MSFYYLQFSFRKSAFDWARTRGNYGPDQGQSNHGPDQNKKMKISFRSGPFSDDLIFNKSAFLNKKSDFFPA